MNGTPAHEGVGQQPDSARLKVLILPSWYPSSEAPLTGIFIQQQAQALAACCDVAVLHLELGGAAKETQVTREGELTVARAALPLLSGASTPPQRLRTLYRITEGYRRAGWSSYRALERVWGAPDLVHVHASIPAVLAAQVISRKMRVPYVVTEHQAGFLLESLGLSQESGRLRQALIRRAMRQAAAMIAVSTHLAEALVAGGYHAKPVVIPNLVRDMDAPPARTARQGTHTPQIVHVSLLRSYEKNIPMLLEALRAANEGGHDYKFRFVGDGPDRPELEALASRAGLLGSRVEFLGARDPGSVRALFESSDFSVVSSRYETFCMAAAESLAAGCPVVSTRCGGPEDFIDDRVGLLVANDDADAMAKGIIEMLRSYARYDPCALHDYAADRFAAPVVVQRILDVYQQALAQG